MTGAETVAANLALNPLIVALVLAGGTGTGVVAVFARFITLGHACLLLVTPHGFALFLVGRWRGTVVGAVVAACATIVVAGTCLEAINGDLIALFVTYFLGAYSETFRDVVVSLVDAILRAYFVVLFVLVVVTLWIALVETARAAP